MAGSHALAHELAAKDQRFAQKKARIRRGLDLERAAHPAAIEEDRLLGQPGEPRARFERRVRRHMGGVAAGGTVDAFAGLGGDGETGPGRHGEILRQPVAAGQAARAVDQDRFGLLARQPRKPQLEAAGLVQPLQPGSLVDDAELRRCRPFRALHATRGRWVRLRQVAHRAHAGRPARTRGKAARSDGAPAASFMVICPWGSVEMGRGSQVPA